MDEPLTSFVDTAPQDDDIDLALPALEELPAGARLLFLGLWVEADSQGRVGDRAAVLAGAIFPYEPAAAHRVPIWLRQLKRAGYIERSDGLID